MREDIRILSIEEITKGLEKLPGWGFKENKIFKEFKFKDFLTVLDFINRLAGFFEKNDHHPDIHIFYSKVLFELTRWDVDGKVTDMDFMTAEEIENLYKDFQKLA